MLIARSVTLSAAILLLASAADAHQPSHEVLVFRHTNVVPMTTATVFEDYAVVVRGGLIQRLGPDRSVDIPTRSKQVDGRGLFLMPGLVDAHTHPGGVAELPSFVRYGQTTIFTLNGEGKTLRHDPELVKPHMLTSTTTIDGPGYVLNTRFHMLRRPADAARILNFEKGRGADFIKVYGQLSEPAITALDHEGGLRGLVVVGHLPRSFSLDKSLPHMRLVAHTEEYLHIMPLESSDADLEHAADVAAKYHVSLMTTSVTMTGQPRHMLDLPGELADPERQYLSDGTYQQWLPKNDRYATMSAEERTGFANEVKVLFPKLKRLNLMMHQRGLRLLAGTDSPTFCYPGKCLLEELQLLRDSGLSQFDVLRTATVNPGWFAHDVLGKAERFGTVEVGSRADLILLGANPLASLGALSDLRGVLVGGHWRTVQAIDVRRAELGKQLRNSHALIYRYEQLLAHKDVGSVLAFLRAIRPGSVGFNVNTVINDAETIEGSGQRPEAMALMTAFTKLLPTEFAIWNELGSLRAQNAQPKLAIEAYRRSLELKPLNGTALKALKTLLHAA